MKTNSNPKGGTKSFEDLIKLRLTDEEIEDIHKWAINERNLLMKTRVLKTKMPVGYEKEERRHDRTEEAEEKKHEARHDKAMVKALKKKKSASKTPKK